MTSRDSRRLGKAALLFLVALGMLGLFASAASAASLSTEFPSDGTPTTMSAISIAPDPNLPVDTNPPNAASDEATTDSNATTVSTVSATTTGTDAATTPDTWAESGSTVSDDTVALDTTVGASIITPTTVAEATSIPTPVGINAGGGGSAHIDMPLWILAMLPLVLALGVARSAARTPRGKARGLARWR